MGYRVQVRTKQKWERKRDVERRARRRGENAFGGLDIVHVRDGELAGGAEAYEREGLEELATKGAGADREDVHALKGLLDLHPA